MADSKVSALTELTTPAGVDLLHIIDDPSGTPASKKVTVTNLFKNAPILALGSATAFSSADATPSVSGGSFFKTANAGATTITDFDDGTTGQVIFVLIDDANTTVDFTSSGLKGNSGGDWSPGDGDWMACIYDGTDWYCGVFDTTA